jgi:hypothetical protein
MVACLALLALPDSLRADPADSVGLSWRGRGSSGTCTAALDGPAAAYYNPAGLSLAARPSFFFGAGYVHSGLRPDAAHAAEGAFLELGLSVPILDVTSRRPRFPKFWLGLAAMTPPDSLYQLDLYDEEDLVYPLLSSRERRLTLSAALAATILERVALGVGVEILPTVKGEVTVDLADPEGRNVFRAEVGYRASATAGLTVIPHRRVRIGLSYRSENKAEIDIPVNVKAEGIDLAARVSALTYYVPHRLALGLEWEFVPRFFVAADVAWFMFSRFDFPTSDVALYDKGREDTLQADVPDAGLKDVVSPSLALRYSGRLEAILAYRYTPSAVENQPGRTNLLDSDQHRVSLALKVRLFEAKTQPASLAITTDFFVTFVPERTFYKEEVLAGNPGYPSVTFGGYRLGGSLGLDLTF